MSTAKPEENNAVFSQYPAGADNYFIQNKISFSLLPKQIRSDIELNGTILEFSSAGQYIEYLESEYAFWNREDPNGILSEHVRIGNIKSAISQFRQAIQYYETGSTASGENYLRQSISYMSNGHLGSHTRLACYLLEHIDKGKDFSNGFMWGLSNPRSNYTLNLNALEGFVVSLEYCKAIGELCSIPPKLMADFQTNLKNASDDYARLNREYAMSFHNQETRLKELGDKFDNQIDNIKAESDTYFNEKEKRCRDLEALYEEKLKLEAPAEYWAQVEKQYLRKARVWLWVSIGFSLLIIGALISSLFWLPGVISPESHWFEVFKNSAILTVITSIAIYMLRLFVKLCSSSYHLSRDATERNKLTYFYLALIEKKAVTEKERAIVLNSLFSRADTGLLKNDSSPTTPGGLSDVLQNIK